MIRITELSKKFKKVEALKNVNVHFKAGQCIAIIGPNASGKTTLIKSILGMVKPDAGQILFKGHSIHNDRGYLKDIGYMPQIGRYPDRMKVREVFELMKAIRSSKDQPPLDEALIEVFELQNIFNKPMYTLSGGTRQKVSAALAFLFTPQVLILDEPTAGLDPLSSEILKSQIKSKQEEGKLTLITSHILNDLEEVCNYVLYLHEGQIQLFQSVDELKDLTGEFQLSKAITKMMKSNLIPWEKSSPISSMI